MLTWSDTPHDGDVTCRGCRAS